MVISIYLFMYQIFCLRIAYDLNRCSSKRNQNLTVLS